MTYDKKIRTVLTVLLILGLLLSPSTTNAETDSKPVLGSYTGSVNGVERTLNVTVNSDGETELYIKIGDEGPYMIDDHLSNSGFDQYGAVWSQQDNNSLAFWSYDLSPTFQIIRFKFIKDPIDPTKDFYGIASLVFKGTGSEAIVVGFRTFSGEIYPLPSFEEMKATVDPNSSVPEPCYVPKKQISIPEKTPEVETSIVETPSPSPTVVPATNAPSKSETPTPKPLSTVTPTQDPMVTALPTQVPITPTSSPSPSVPATQAPDSVLVTPVPTPSLVEPTVTPTNKKLVIKNSKKKGVTTRSLCEGNKVIIEYSLKKGKLNWKTSKKKGSMKNVKYVVFIKKSRNLYVGDRKGRGYIISSKNGKKRLVIKKGAKKPTLSGGFGVKVGRIKISNK